MRISSNMFSKEIRFPGELVLEILSSCRIRLGAMLLGIFAIRCTRSHLDGLLFGKIVPHMHHIRVLCVDQCLLQQLRFEKVSPMLPGYRIEGIAIEHLESHATLPVFNHQCNIVGTTNSLNHTRYNARSIITPISAIEILLKVAKTRFGDLMAKSSVREAHYTGSQICI